MSYLCDSVLIKLALVLLLQTVITISIEHSTGTKDLFGPGDALQNTDLFNKSSIKQTNYTIRYKYVTKAFGGVIFFAQINVTGAQNSTSEMSYSGDIDLDHERYVSATVNVFNANHLKSSVEVRGLKGISIEGLSTMLSRKYVKPRSYAFICTQRDSKEDAKSKRLIEIGKRVPGDFIIQIRRQYSTNGRLDLQFHDPGLKPTYILVNVNSPWAITFSNKIITSQDQFRATIYGLKQNDFAAKMIIFGTKMPRV